MYALTVVESIFTGYVYRERYNYTPVVDKIRTIQTTSPPRNVESNQGGLTYQRVRAHGAGTELEQLWTAEEPRQDLRE